MANSVDQDQTAPIGAGCSGSMLFASTLISSVILGNYLQQTTSADAIFRCIFFGALRVKDHHGVVDKPDALYTRDPSSIQGSLVCRMRLKAISV